MWAGIAKNGILYFAWLMDSRRIIIISLSDSRIRRRVNWDRSGLLLHLTVSTLSLHIQLLLHPILLYFYILHYYKSRIVCIASHILYHLPIAYRISHINRVCTMGISVHLHLYACSSSTPMFIRNFLIQLQLQLQLFKITFKPFDSYAILLFLINRSIQ